MRVLSVDLEATTHNKGNCYDSRNRLVCYSVATDLDCHACQWSERALKNLYLLIKHSSLLVGFNFKYDLGWLKKEGVEIDIPLWDVQIAEFILSNQTQRFPSLNDTCIKYNIPVKKDVVKEEYWEKGIQTDQIPWPILEEYAAHDAKITLACYHAQRKLMTPAQIKLCMLMCQDLFVLQEMEANGLKYNEKLCEERAQEVDNRIQELKQQLQAFYPNVPLNFSSNDHLSAFLYGGVVKEEAKEHIGFFKTGERAGQPKYKNIIIEHQLPRQYTPLKGSELLKEGMYATDESTLRKLKGKKKTVDLLLELAKLEKLNGTYYKGLVTLRKEMYWEEGVLHGQYNQCQAATGRLSSSRPNMQNMASDIQDIFESRYD